MLDAVSVPRGAYQIREIILRGNKNRKKRETNAALNSETPRSAAGNTINHGTIWNSNKFKTRFSTCVDTQPTRYNFTAVQSDIN